MKVQILGAAFTLTSALKKADIEKMQKYTPRALQIADENKDVIYAVGYGKTASINGVGVTFNSANEAGEAQATFNIPADVKDKAAYVEDNFGLSIFRLGEVEEAAGNALAELNDKFEAVGAVIKVVE